MACAPHSLIPFFLNVCLFLHGRVLDAGFLESFLVPCVPDNYTISGLLSAATGIFVSLPGRSGSLWSSYPSSPSNSLLVLACSSSLYQPPALLPACPASFPMSVVFPEQVWGCFIGSCPAVSTEAEYAGAIHCICFSGWGL